jgi:hypothetical protein
MSKVVLLDSSPLGLVTNPRMTDTALLCNEWLEALLVANVRVIIPEIADYEIRQELLRANKSSCPGFKSPSWHFSKVS